MRQINLIPAGVQSWHREVISTAVDHSNNVLYFAYVSAIALYIYRKEKTSEPILWKILSGHQKTIRCVVWAGHNSNLIATAGSDGTVLNVLPIK